MTAGSKALWRHCWNIAGNIIKTRRYWCAQTIGRFTFNLLAIEGPHAIRVSRESNPSRPIHSPARYIYATAAGGKIGREGKRGKFCAREKRAAPRRGEGDGMGEGREGRGLPPVDPLLFGMYSHCDKSFLNGFEVEFIVKCRCAQV